jgi:hypothetical protein
MKAPAPRHSLMFPSAMLKPALTSLALATFSKGIAKLESK